MRDLNLANIRYFAYIWSMHNQAMQDFKAGIFQGLAHPTRVAITETVTANARQAPFMSAWSWSKQTCRSISRNRAKGIVSTRKDGNQVFIR